MKTKTFWIYFTRPKKLNPVSWLIMKFEKMNASHCSLLYWSEDYNAYMVVHSKMYNVHMMTMGHFMKDSVVEECYEFEVFEPELDAALNTLAPQLGTGYAYLQLLQLLAKRLLGFIKIKFNDIGSTCSELMADFLYAGIIPTPSEEVDTSQMGLVEVRDLCQKYGRKK